MQTGESLLRRAPLAEGHGVMEAQEDNAINHGTTDRPETTESRRRKAIATTCPVTMRVQ